MPIILSELILYFYTETNHLWGRERIGSERKVLGQESAVRRQELSRR